MKMHKFSLVAALALGSLLACTTIASAQEAPKESKKGGRFSPEARLQQLTEQLNLTDAQKPKVKAVLEDTSKKMQEVRADTSLSQEQRREKMRPIIEDQNKKMKEILTPEQYEKYQTMPRQGRPGGTGGGKSDSQKAEKKTQ